MPSSVPWLWNVIARSRGAASMKRLATIGSIEVMSPSKHHSSLAGAASNLAGASGDDDALGSLLCALERPGRERGKGTDDGDALEEREHGRATRVAAGDELGADPAAGSELLAHSGRSLTCPVETR